MDDDQGDVTQAAIQLGQAASQLGLVPLSPHALRLTALEAEVARLLAENLRLATATAMLAKSTLERTREDAAQQIKGTIPARALARNRMRIGLTSELH